MEKIDDDMLLDELKKRLEENRIALANLRTMTQNLETLNEKLRQSESLKTDFLSNIRNEINNPLTSIMGLTRQIVDKKSDADRSREIAGMIYHEAFDLDFQLRNIFSAAELEAGETTSSVALVEVAGLARSQCAAFAHKAAEKKVSLNFQCVCPDGDEITFKTSPEWLQKVISNLLANAIEFCHEGKSVTLRIWQEDARLNIAISDEGPGIPEADRKKVFDRFVQLDTGVRKRHKGHGLGLSIVKALVGMMNGSITLADNKGNGCMFTVSLAEMETGGLVDVTSGDGNEFIFGDGKQF